MTSNKTRVARSAVAAAVIAAFAAGCSNDSLPRLAEAHAAPAPAVVQAGPRGLPDFSSLVEAAGPSVVNISVTRSDNVAGNMPDLSGIPEDSPMFEFFKHFGMPMPMPMPMPGPQGRGEPDTPEQHGVGSGFIVSEDGYVLTNAHVVDGADTVTVKLTDRREFTAKVIGVDKRTDVALVKIDAKNLPALTIGDPGKVKVGEWVAAIGSPFGFENSVTSGIVSAKGRSLPDESYVPFIQTDVAVNPGNSGGPLFNLNGEVIGINSQIYSRTGGYMGVSFAIPIDIAMNVADQIKTHGKVTRGQLGVRIQPISGDLAKSFGLQNAKGALIAGVDPDSAAAKAGLKPGDVIVEYDGKKVEEFSALPPLVAATKPGAKASVVYLRDGKEQKTTVAVGEAPSDKLAQASTVGAKGETRKMSSLGLAVSELDARERKALGLDGGVKVERAQGPAAKSGIRAGDVIVGVNGARIGDTDDLGKTLEHAQKGAPLALLVRRGDSTIFIPVAPNQG
jgi:serine protease Do